MTFCRKQKMTEYFRTISHHGADVGRTLRTFLLMGVISVAQPASSTLAQTTENDTATSQIIAQAVVSPTSLNSEVLSFDIYSQPIGSAFIAFSAASGIDVIFNGVLPNGMQVNQITGNMSAATALDGLLAGSGFSWRPVDATTVEIIGPEQSSQAQSSQSQTVTLPAVRVQSQAEPIGPFNTPDFVYSTPGGVAVITQEQMEKIPLRESRDIFNSVAGADIANDSRDPGLTVNLRGQQEMGRVNVNIDGARQNYNQTTHGSTSRVYVDPGLLANVSIDKTNMDQSGGAGTSAGIVTMRTLNTDDIITAEEEMGGTIDASHGSNGHDFVGKTAVAARITPKFDMAAAMSRRVTGDYDPGKRNVSLFTSGAGRTFTIDDINRDFTFVRQTSGLLKANAQLDEDQELNFGYVGTTMSYAKSSDINNAFSDFNETENHTLTVKHDWNPDSALVDMKTGLFWTRTENIQIRPPRINASGVVTTDSFESVFKVDTLGADMVNTSNLVLQIPGKETSTLRFDYGVEYFKDQAKTVSTTGGLGGAGGGFQLEGSTPSGTRNVYGGFMKTTYNWNDVFSVRAGLRYDQYSLYGESYFCETFQNPNNLCADGGTPIDVDLSDSALSPSIGVDVTPVPGLQLFANYRKNTRAPTVMETMIKGEHIGNVGIPFYANANLQPERSTTKEIGVNLMFDNVLQAGDGFRAKLSYYRSTIDNYITLGFVPQPTTNKVIPGLLETSQMAAGIVNLSDPVDINGVELELAYDAGQYYLGGTLTLNDLDLVGNYDPFILDTVYDEFALTGFSFFAGGAGDPLYGTIDQLNGIYATPSRKITVDGGFRLFRNDLNLGMRATFVFPQDNIGSQTLSTVVGEYFRYRTYDFYSSYKVNDDVRLAFNVTNLLDEAYVQGTGGTFAAAPGRTAIMSLSARF